MLLGAHYSGKMASRRRADAKASVGFTVTEEGCCYSSCLGIARVSLVLLYDLFAAVLQAGMRFWLRHTTSGIIMVRYYSRCE